MDRMFSCIDETVNKSAIDQLVKFLGQFPDIIKWFMSRLCIGLSGFSFPALLPIFRAKE